MRKQIENRHKKGSVESFDKNWGQRQEAVYNHWTNGSPKNQIQLAFRNHWSLFSELLTKKKNGTCLEVGCGRGSISSYFAENGYSCVLLDSSKNVLEVAKTIFRRNGHNAKFVHGDANELPFKENSFDVVVSIGLLEHFENIKTPILEQIRVLKSGGIFLGYIVPENLENIQKYFSIVNSMLKSIHCILSLSLPSKKGSAKSPIYRSSYGSEEYLKVLDGQPINNVQVCGMYPLPLISHSPDFPFSLLPEVPEMILTRVFKTFLAARKKIYKKNPWECRETLGQAFLLSFNKE